MRAVPPPEVNAKDEQGLLSAPWLCSIWLDSEGADTGAAEEGLNGEPSLFANYFAAWP
jgi:hypothetical protein